MKRSTDRILLSHAGSLHRPPALAEAMRAHKDGEPFDAKLDSLVKDGVDEVVRLQAENGVDVVNDGEYGKSSWQTYARGRLGGIELRDIKEGDPVGTLPITAREQLAFPEYFGSLTQGFAGGGFARQAVYAVGPLTYKGQAETKRDIENLRNAMKGQDVAEGVLTALAPGTIEHWLRNDYFKTEEECLYAVADAMHEEYKMITDAGFILQLDDPDLPDGYACHPELSAEEYVKFANVRVEAINHAIRDIPEEQVRLHICWGSIHHPHTQDLPLSDIIDVMYKVKAQCYSIEAANPMHEHEWEVFKDHPLPDGKIVMPGVLGHCAREFVEHPQLVAQRLVRYANLVGKENVIAGTDCGLQRTAHPSITWAKFRAGSEGCAIATKELWGRS
ncbi:MAG TPA: cobalamin-independent methionine synthase II family protein [Dehalococcoidia bacterium]|nr:cobalamin-independent methionine synthase II family protein [Dehalococcoidia bacterium]